MFFDKSANGAKARMRRAFRFVSSLLSAMFYIAVASSLSEPKGDLKRFLFTNPAIPERKQGFVGICELF